MRVFVTGGAGYVGSFCVAELCAAGHEVVVFDNLVQGHVRAIDERAIFVRGDLADTALIRETFEKYRFDGIMHFAAHLNVNESVNEPLKYYRNNMINTISLLEAAHDHGIRKMVFSSTCATYGLPPSMPITEDMPQHTINPYGRSKLAIEWALRDCAHAWGLGATALRYFNASGAAADGTRGEDHDPEYHLIPVVLEVAMGKREQIEIFGVDYPTPDGSCVRDYIHVEDLGTVHRLALESSRPGEFRYFNVGTGRGVSVKELVDIAREVTGHEIPAQPAPRREGDPPELYADPTKIMTELSWQPKYPDVRDTIATAWKWHSTHPDGYERKS